MNLTALFALGIGFFIHMSSALAAPACYTQEVDPSTGKLFSSEEAYQAVLTSWEDNKPSTPGLGSQAKAYMIYKKEKATADGFKNDKLAHCYVGCRISQETSLQTAEYVGWFGERRDLKDCNRHSHFDLGDFEATVRGGQIGLTAPDARTCLDVCQQNY